MTAGIGSLLILCLILAGTGEEPNRENAVTEEETEVSTEPEVPALDEEQTAILDGIIEELIQEDLSAAASRMMEHEEILQDVFYQVMEGNQYLYRDSRLWEELEGQGLVMKKPLSVFYGTFQEGLPEGAGVSLQGIDLDGLRYDYSRGMWKQGMMDGEGVVGYYYFQGVPGEENQAVQKEGIFSEDLMEGSFVYRTINSEGITTIWDMDAEAGRTKLDERWVYEEDKQEYYLISNQNTSHAYVLAEEALEEVRWRNMLPWKE